MTKVKVFFIICFLLGIFCLLGVPAGEAAVMDIARPMDPVIVSGQSLINFIDVPVANIFVYAYSNGAWRQIPFQIDEKDGTDYFGAKDNLLDLTDEVCFLAADLGDSVANSTWISDASSKNYLRYQVCVYDTTQTPAKKGWAYIYRSNTLAPAFTPYMTYEAPVNNVDDKIHGSSYLFGHDDNSIPDLLNIKPDVNDLLDRWKLRVDGTLVFWPYSINENHLANPDLSVAAGRNVRVIRKSIFDFTFVEGAQTIKLDFLTYYYPQFLEINISTQSQFSLQWGIDLLRFSMDFSSVLKGNSYKFYNAYNNNIPVDGAPDVVNQQIDVDDANWFMQYGTLGLIFGIFNVPELDNANYSFYYKDDETPDANDTGDQLSYGDSGLEITSININDAIHSSSPLDFTVRLYYLGTEHTTNVSDTLKTQFKNPLKVVVGNGQIVPVELSSFKALFDGKQVTLNWVTKTESNNYGFEIHRKSSQNENWETIGFVQGNGTTTSANEYEFIDKDIKKGTLEYRLKQLDTDGQFAFSESRTVAVTVPVGFALEQNYPNPFNPVTEIGFTIPEQNQGTTELNIYNVIGQHVRTLIYAGLEAGYHKITWDGKNNNGQQVMSGTYIYQLKVGNNVLSRKMIKLE